MREFRRRADFRHLEHALGQRPRLVEDHILRPGQGLQVVGAFHQYAAGGRPADAPEEAQGDGYHQSAGTTDDQEGQCPDDPCAPVRRIAQEQVDHRGNHRQGQGAVADGRGIVSGELGDEVLRPGLLHAGILHQVQDFGHRGLPEFFRGPDPQQACEVHAAADDLLPLLHLPGDALSGEGAGVQGGASFRHDAVDGYFFPGLHQNHRAHLHIVRIHLLQVALLILDVGIIGADVHQGADVLPAAPHGHGLEQLADLVEEHDRHAFGELALQPPALIVDAQQHGPHRGHGHQEVLVEDLPVADAQHRLAQDVIAYDEVGHQVQREPRIPLHGHEVQRHHEDCRCDDAVQHFFLFRCHVVILPFHNQSD